MALPQIETGRFAEEPAEIAHISTTAVNDPLGVAIQALAKLREHGHSGYIPPSSNSFTAASAEEAADTRELSANVVDIRSRQEPSHMPRTTASVIGNGHDAARHRSIPARTVKSTPRPRPTTCTSDTSYPENEWVESFRQRRALERRNALTATDSPARIKPANDMTELTPAQHEMIDNHYHLVRYVVRRTIFKGTIGPEEVEEAIGDGCFALVRAAVKHDPSKVNAQATTESDYFTRCIWGGVMRGLRDRRGRSETGGVANLKPSVTQGTAHSFDAPLRNGDDVDITFGDIMTSSANQEEFDLSVLNADLQRALRGVPARDREIFLRCTVHDETQETVAQAFGVTQMQISRIRAQVVERLRMMLGNYNE